MCHDHRNSIRLFFPKDEQSLRVLHPPWWNSNSLKQRRRKSVLADTDPFTYRFFETRAETRRDEFSLGFEEVGLLSKILGGGPLWVGEGEIEIEERRENADKSIRTFALLILAWLRVEYDFTTKRVEVNYFRVGG